MKKEKTDKTQYKYLVCENDDSDSTDEALNHHLHPPTKSLLLITELVLISILSWDYLLRVESIYLKYLIAIIGIWFVRQKIDAFVEES